MMEIICGFKVRVQRKTYKVVCDNIGDAIDVITHELNIAISDIDSINPWYDEIYVMQNTHRKEKHTVKA